MDFKKLLESTGLKPNSVKLYTSRLNKLHNEFSGNSNNLNYLLDTENIMNYINGLNSTDNKLANLNAILKVITDSNTIKFYTEKRNDLNKVKFEKYKNNVKTDDFIDFKILLNATPPPNFNDCILRDSSRGSVEKVINDMMLFISVRYPLRLSLYDINVVRKKNLMNDTTKNYLYITNNGISFIMNEFKNVKQMGQQTIKMFESDAKIVREYLKFLKRNNVSSNKFILNYYIKVIEFSSADMFAKKLKNLLKKKLNKDITMNQIRSSYETALIQSAEYNKMTNEAKEQAHARLLHTPFMANLAYNKIEPPKVQTRLSDKKCECCGK